MIFASNVTRFISFVSFLVIFSFLPVASAQGSGTEPLGIVTGSFKVFPSVEVGYMTDSNIYADKEDETDDTIILLKPAIMAKSDWNNHMLNVEAGGEWATFSDNTDEDYGDYHLLGDGRLDVMRGSNVFGDFGYSQSHEDRGSPDAVNGSEPTLFATTSWTIGYSHAVSLISLEIKASSAALDFDDTPTTGGGVVSNEGRNRTRYNYSVKVGYKIDKLYEAFVKGEYNDRDYVNSADKNGFDRDSSGSNIVLGFKYELSGVTSAEFSAGYRSQTYEDSRFEEISGIGMSGILFWTPSKLTVVIGNISRAIEETTQEDLSGIFVTSLGFNVIHSMTDFIRLKGGASYTDMDYQGDYSRTDTITSAMAEVDYLLNRYSYVGATFSYESFDSSNNADDYTRSKGMILVGLQI